MQATVAWYWPFYYRCLGSDAYRHGGKALCDQKPIRQDLLDHLVWSEVRHLLKDPTLIQAELNLRLEAARFIRFIHNLDLVPWILTFAFGWYLFLKGKKLDPIRIITEKLNVSIEALQNEQERKLKLILRGEIYEKLDYHTRRRFLVQLIQQKSS